MFSSKQTHLFNYFICYHRGVARNQTQPESFSREKKEPGDEVEEYQEWDG